MDSLWTLRRSPADAKVAGVCSPLAVRWGVDPTLVRVGCVVLALSGGVGLVLYAAGWLLLPAEGRAHPPVQDLLGGSVARWRKEAWVALVAAACLLLLMLNPFGIAPVLVLTGIWYVATTRRGRPVRPAPAPWSPSGPAPSEYSLSEHTLSGYPMSEYTWSPIPQPVRLPDSPGQDVDPVARDRAAYLALPDPVGLYAEPAGSTAIAQRPADWRSARRLRLVCLAVAALTVGGLGLADALGASIPLAGYLAAALLVLGLGLVAATWFGRARGLLPLGLLLAVAVVISSMVGPASARGGWAAETRTYQSAAQLPAAGDTHDLGRLEVDLRQLALATDTTYAAHVEVGRLAVTVPRDARVVVDYRVDHGVVTAFGSEVAGGQALRSQTAPAGPTTGPTLTLRLSVDLGHLEVRR